MPDEFAHVRSHRSPRLHHRLEPRHRPRLCPGGRRGRRRGGAQFAESRRMSTRRWRASSRRRATRRRLRLRRGRPGVGRGTRGADGGGARADRHPVQQCRHPAPRAARGFPDRDLARGDGDQPRRRLLCRPGGGEADDPAPPRQDHQHLLARQRDRPRDHLALYRVEGRGEDADQGDVRRVGEVQHPGERHRPRLHRHRDERGADPEPRVRRLRQAADAGRALGRGRRAEGRRDLPSAPSDFVNGQIIYVDGGVLSRCRGDIRTRRSENRGDTPLRHSGESRNDHFR